MPQGPVLHVGVAGVSGGQVRDLAMVGEGSEMTDRHDKGSSGYAPSSSVSMPTAGITGAGAGAGGGVGGAGRLGTGCGPDRPRTAHSLSGRGGGASESSVGNTSLAAEGGGEATSSKLIDKLLRCIMLGLFRCIMLVQGLDDAGIPKYRL